MSQTELPEFESKLNFVGPFQHHDVVVNGREVPFLRANPLDNGKVHITLDRRLGVTLSTEEAERFLPFLADAIAVASGYTAHPDEGSGEPNRRHPFPSVTPLFSEATT